MLFKSRAANAVVWLVLVLLALPPLLFGGFMILLADTVDWEHQRSGGNFDLLFELSLPFVVVALVVALAAVSRKRRRG